MDSSPGRNSTAIAELVEYGEFLIDQTDQAASDRAVRRILAHFPNRPHRRRWVPVLAALGLLAVSSVGLAAAADSAAPGDFLYSLDRGYEGLGDLLGSTDRAPERIEEATDLIGRDRLPEALAALQDAAASHSQVAADELEAAAVALAAAGINGPSADRSALRQHLLGVLTAVQDLLAGGPDSSQGSTTAIAAIERHVDAIRQISAVSPGDNPSVTAPGQTGDTSSLTSPGQTANNPPVTAPGQSKDKDKGKSDGANQSGDS